MSNFVTQLQNDIAVKDSGAATAARTDATPEVSVVMPCLNEADTLAVCVGKALRALAGAGISGEVIIADNGSTDGSQAIATAAGARVVAVPYRGYGNTQMGARRTSRI